jgi:tRNA (cytidine/uridine-2'-O-)-methyltransferase
MMVPDRPRLPQKKTEHGLGKARLARRGCNINSPASKAQNTPIQSCEALARKGFFGLDNGSETVMRLALYQPDIPQNTGALLRLATCLGLAADVIEPCGFVMSDARLKRAGMDYLLRADIRRHASWQAFEDWRAQARRTAGGHRLVLLTTKGLTPYPSFAFAADDILMVGRESAGVPDEVAETADARLVIPMARGLRSLNVATAAAMVLGEALRQTAGFPDLPAAPGSPAPHQS